MARGADRYFGSFPKVGIVIPNPSTWLLPEFQDLASALERTLMLPPNGELSNGVSLQPDSDGFLIFLPSGAYPRRHIFVCFPPVVLRIACCSVIA